MVRPKLIEAFNEIRQYGVATDKLIDLHEQISPLIDQISGLLVQAGIEHVLHRVNPGAALPPDTEVAELITMLVRFRTQAVSAVSATLAFSIESTIEYDRRSDPRRIHREGTAEPTGERLITPTRWCPAACW